MLFDIALGDFLARCKATLKKNGVKVVPATEVISDGAEGIILESVLEGYAEYYSADLSEKVVRGMTENALKSKYNGGNIWFGFGLLNCTKPAPSNKEGAGFFTAAMLSCQNSVIPTRPI